MSVLTPNVTVITVCYNEIDCIRRCMESVLRQTYKNIQYVVVDGASTDGTTAIIEAYAADLFYYVSEVDNGIFPAMNKALAAAADGIVYFLNADDYFFSDDTVRDAVDCFVSDPGIELLSGRVRFFNTPLRDGTPYERADFSYVSKLDLYRRPIPQQCVFARRSLFDELGPYDERYRMCADYEWLIRALDRGTRVKQVDAYFCHFDYRGISYTENAKRKREKNLIILRNSSPRELLCYLIAGLAALPGRIFHGS